MDSRAEELIKWPPYVYDLPYDIISTLVPSADRGKFPDTHIDVETQLSDNSGIEIDSVVGGSIACSLCNLVFLSVEDQRSHVKSDLHRYNLKQKLKGLSPVNEHEFEILVGDLNESLSGSESSGSDSDFDSEDAENRKDSVLSALLKKQIAITEHTRDADNTLPKRSKQESGVLPIIWFTTSVLPSNFHFGIYRALFTASEIENDSKIVEILRKKQLSPGQSSEAPLETDNEKRHEETIAVPHVFLCMIGGGHFAAMVVSLAPKNMRSKGSAHRAREATILTHKTFHRYTTRRKQGGAQSANDSAKGLAHSAGSSLRRYNEAALTDEIRLLLSDWKGLIDSSELLFVRASGSTNKRTLFGPYEGQVLRQTDLRLRGFPFSTRRATQNELLRSFLELTRIKVQKIDESLEGTKVVGMDAPNKFSRLEKRDKKPFPAVLKLSEEEETALFHTTQIQSLIRRSKLPGLLLYIKSSNLSPDYRFCPENAQQNYHASTPLHLAASLNSAALVLGLLLKGDANPTMLNGDAKPAFDLAGDRATRDAFRVARSSLGELQWDWNMAHVPLGITRSEANEREKRDRNETAQKEEKRRKAEAERLQIESPKVGEPDSLGKVSGKGRALTIGHTQKGFRESREEELKGLTPEMRTRLEREQRARAAEERLRRMKNGS